MLDIDASLPMEPPKSYRNYDECEVRAALVDQSGGAIEGFTLEKSRPLLESGRQEMCWEGKEVAELKGEGMITLRTSVDKTQCVSRSQTQARASLWNDSRLCLIST